MDRQVSHQLYLQGAVSTDIGELLLGRSLITSECRWLTNNLMSQAWIQCLNLGLQLLTCFSSYITTNKGDKKPDYSLGPTANCSLPRSPLLPSPSPQHSRHSLFLPPNNWNMASCLWWRTTPSELLQVLLHQGWGVSSASSSPWKRRTPQQSGLTAVVSQS